MPRLASHRSSATHAGLEPGGYVHISGDFVHSHRSEVETVLRREEQSAHRDSPAARIVAGDDDGSGGLLVTTTTAHLAHRIGRALHKELGGELNHGFCHQYKLALVWWRR